MVKCCTKKREKGHGNVRWKSRVGSKTGGKKRRHTQSGNSSKTRRQKHPRDKLIEVLEKQLHLRFCPSLFVLFLVSTIAFLSHFAFNPISPFNFRNCKIRQSSMACTHSRLQRRWRQNTMEMNLEKMDEKKPKIANILWNGLRFAYTHSISVGAMQWNPNWEGKKRCHIHKQGQSTKLQNVETIICQNEWSAIEQKER